MTEAHESRPLSELDKPVDQVGGTEEEPYYSRAPADFEGMTVEQRHDWPWRAARRWMLGRTAFLLVPPVLGMIVFVVTHRLSAAVSGAGLSYDILGVYWLAESLLVGELEANWLTTFGAMGNRGLVALRDGYQARFALAVAFTGFFLQFLSDVV